IIRNQIHVSYQPILDALSGEICGYEALMRWNRPGHGLTKADDGAHDRACPRIMFQHAGETAVDLDLVERE
ncbi:EAL domain-containing protein, partial [Rhizobium leguminosarum]|uniref:EAL domain-containing protein n=1 Tax=Rhizobium leguminosarum TaxID=384 RepID=UPI003F9D142A